MKQFSYQEVSEHNTENDLWMIIEGKVYDCTKFLPEHPGGEEVMVDCGGKDATQVFEDIGHSRDAYGMLEKCLIGELDLTTVPADVKASGASGSTDSGESSQLPLILSALVVLAGAAYYFYQSK